jgi:hypothetical protein
VGRKEGNAALTAMGFDGRVGFQYNYDLCLMAEYGPRVKDSLNLSPHPGIACAVFQISRPQTKASQRP